MATVADLRVVLEGLKDELHTDIGHAVDVMQKAVDAINSESSDAIQALIDDANAAKAEVQTVFMSAVAALEAVVTPPAPPPVS